MASFYQGHCHCGAVRFSYEGEAITRGVRCNCSFCSRRGAMASAETIPAEKLKIEATDGALGLYQFGLKTAKHYFCKNCGIYPFHETARKPGYFRVNLGCVDGIDIFSLQADVLDGKSLP